MSSLFHIALFPFTSKTFFVLFPCACSACIAVFGLVFRLIRGDYRGIHS